MTEYEKEYYHNIKSIDKSLELINLTLDRLLQCFLPPKLIINETNEKEIVKLLKEKSPTFYTDTDIAYKSFLNSTYGMNNEIEPYKTLLIKNKI